MIKVKTFTSPLKIFHAKLEKINSEKSMIQRIETFEKCSILLNTKAGENFNHPGTICRTYGAGRHTFKYFED